ncbi:DUF2207 family protein [Amycolatopsis sp. NPDC058986]|uniref:DUF2207 family protein n=1 Tax=unclassified Amycolatopsis TaxID=2618356 RepID=UPI00366C2329
MTARPGVLAGVAALLLAFTPAASAQDQPDQPPLPGLPQSAEIQLKLQRDGSLSVAEAISVPNGATMNRRVPLKTPAAHHRDRVYGLRDVFLEGSGSAQLDGGVFTAHLTEGTSILRYTVDGAVSADKGGVEHVTWPLASGWDTELKLVRASFAAPRIPTAVDCVAGPDGSGTHCGAAQIDHAGLTRFSQQNLPAGQRMSATVELPPGTVPANAKLVPSATIGGAFVRTPPVIAAWWGFAAVLVVAAVLVWLTRRRDARPGEPLPVELLSPDGEFASPDGVLPGHVATVTTGRASPVDLAATVLDLVVRNYLWVSAEDTGWRLTRRNPADEHLTVFERAVFAVVLPDGEDSVTLAELRRRRIDIGQVRDALHADVVRNGWFSQPPSRRLGRLGRAGIRVVFYGLFLTVLLAFTVGYAPLGVIVMLAGAAAVVASALLPARRSGGRLLRRRLRGLGERLALTKAKSLAKPERELVFSRGLPYALALGELGAWTSIFAELKHPPPVYWCEAEVPIGRAGEFAAALAGAFAAARRGRLFTDAGSTG